MEELTRAFLLQKVDEFVERDDVFSTAFLRGLILLCDSSAPKPPESDVQDLLVSLGNLWYEVISAADDHRDLKQGVYVASGRCLYEVYRLYDDSHGAFTQTFTLGRDR